MVSGTREKIFVYAVCGAAKYLDELHYSIQALSVHCPGQRIIVVTDSSRNDYRIRYSDVIDIETPKELNNHEASIYLKTSLGKTLATGALYCYLDADVIALNADAKEIFEQFEDKVLFAADYRKLREFSPFAANCECVERRAQKKQLLEILEAHDTDQPDNLPRKNELKQLLDELGRNLITKWLADIRFRLSGNVFRLNDSYFFYKDKKVWKDASGNTVMYDFDDIEEDLAAQLGLRYIRETNTWLTQKGEDVISNECDHLVGLIKKKFGVSVTELNWQHWNGGVFLFDDSGREFLNSWHQKTIEIFGDDAWTTRDQGTLVATVWEFGLQNNRVLGPKWNYLPERDIETLVCDDGVSLQIDGQNHLVTPNFIHFYHHFNDAQFNLWNWAHGFLKPHMVN